MYSTEKRPLCCTVCLSITVLHPVWCLVRHVLMSPDHMVMTCLSPHAGSAPMTAKSSRQERRGVEAVQSHSESYSLSKCKGEKK